MWTRGGPAAQLRSVGATVADSRPGDYRTPVRPVRAGILYERENGKYDSPDWPVVMNTWTTEHRWTFLSNHGHVLVCLGQNPAVRLRDVAARVGITERAVQNIVHDLETAGVITRERSGRRNTYRLNVNVPLRHPLESHRSVGALLGMVLDRNAFRRIPSM